MKDIIPPVSVELIKSELNKDRFIRKTNKGNNEIYVITHLDSPNVMKEIGRIREITFREAGGGTGKEIDIDDYDTAEIPYRQLIVWDPDDEKILGGYRYIFVSEFYDKGLEPDLATSRMFSFSEKFNQEYLPYTIELGRSFVIPDYQSTRKGPKSIYALDNLWDGLGSLVVDHPEVKYFFGKVTMYQHFNNIARDYLLYFLNKYFGDHEGLVKPLKPLDLQVDIEILDNTFKGSAYFDDYKILINKVRENGENIPPLINAYMNLSPSMKVFGTALNDHFGGVEETGILLTIEDIYETKTERHVASYESNKK